MRVSEHARQDEEPFVLPAREAMRLLGEEPAGSDPADDEAEESASDLVGDPERRP